MSDDEQFFIKNINIQNRRIFFIILYTMVIGPLFTVFTYFNIFRISYYYCLLFTLESIVFTILHYFTMKKIKNQRYIMYQGLTLAMMYIATLNICGNTGIYLSFALLPFLSCAYLEKRVTIFATLMDFVLIIISLYIKSFNIYTNIRDVETPFQWFIGAVFGYCFEFIFVCLTTITLTKQMRKTIERMQTKSNRIKNIQIKTIQAFSNIVEWSDQYTGEHIKRTSIYVGLIAKKLVEMEIYTDELTPEKIELIKQAAPLHDIGKINVPNNILNKPGKITQEEFEIMKTHSKVGYEIISSELTDLENPSYIKIAEEMALYHHERWDGKGYPNHVAGTDIPICGRIMAAADVLDALLSKRQYKEAFSLEKTMELFREASGSQFDPEIVKAVLALEYDIRLVVASNQDK